MKRLHMLTIFAALLLLVCWILPTGAEAATEDTGEFSYRTFDGGATITGYSGEGGEVVIPSTLGGYPVTKIGEQAFAYCYGITNITIPNSVTEIGYLAFYQCDGLTSITIPDSVTTIGGAFQGCDYLTDITVGSGVTNIDAYAFEGCTSLTNVYVADIASWCKINFNCTAWGSSNANPLTYAANLYVDGKLLTELVIPEGVTEIGQYAFNGYRNLTSVTLSGSATKIGNYAFSNCTNLTSIVLPEGLISIGEEAFYECNSLTAVNIPKSVTGIGWRAFSRCDSLSGIWVTEGNGAYCSDDKGVLFDKNKTALVQVPGGITGSYSIPEGVKQVGEWTFFECSGLTEVTVPEGITEVVDNMFSYCSSLTTVSLPESITRIGSEAFDGCGSLATINIPDSVTAIGNEAFSECAALTTVTVPAGVTVIESFTFDGCSGLVSVVLPEGVTEIGDHAFQSCSSLQSISIPDSIARIGSGVFGNCGALNYNVYDNATYLGNSANPYALLLRGPSDQITSCKLHEGTKVIAGSAFHNSWQLTGITIPEGVVSIGSNAFNNAAGLTAIVIPDTVTYIGSGAFYSCTALENVYYACYSKTAEAWEQIDFGYSNENLTAKTIQAVDPEKVLIFPYAKCYDTLTEAIADETWKEMLALPRSVTEEVTVSRNIAIDLCGFSINGTVTVADGCTLYCFDSQTDDYTVDDEGGYGKIRAVSGNVQGLPLESAVAEDGYLMLTEEDGISFHRVTLQVTDMTLRASRVGIYYKCKLLCDETVLGSVDRFGVALSVDGAPTAQAPGVLSWFEEVGAGSEQNSVLLHSIMKPDNSARQNTANAAMPVYGSAYILTNDGRYMFGSCVSRSLQQQLELIDQQWTQLTQEQKDTVCQLFKTYAQTMRSWKLPNISAAIGPEASETLTVVEANALGDTMLKNQYTTQKYLVTGVIDEIYSTTYGNMYIRDEAGNRLQVYGTWDAAGKLRYDAMAVKPAVGDTVTLWGVIGYYNNAQMKDGWILEHIPYEEPEIPEEPDVPEEPSYSYATSVVFDPEAGVAYKLGMTQSNLDGWEYFLDGGISDDCLTTTMDVIGAIDVYLEENESGYYLYIYAGESKEYINMVFGESGIVAAYGDTAETVYTFSEESLTLVSNVYGEDYYLGVDGDSEDTAVYPCKVTGYGFCCMLYQVEIIEETPEYPTVLALDLTDGANRTSYTTEQQVWEQNGITLTNNKASSTLNIGDAVPIKLPKGTEVTIECAGMFALEFSYNADDSRYATYLYNSLSAIEGATVEMYEESQIILVYLPETTDSVTFTATGQCRATMLYVYTQE